MAIVDRTNPWPAVVALAGLLVAGCSAASGAAGRLHPGPAASAAAVVSSPAAPVAQGRPTSPTPTPNGRVSSDRRLVLERTITGAISSKSVVALSLIHISEPTRLLSISYAVFCLKK